MIPFDWQVHDTYFFVSRRQGAPAGPNPWNADSLEWSVSSSPPVYGSVHVPTVASRHPLYRLISVLSVLVFLAGCRGGKMEHAYPIPTGGDAEQGRVVLREAGCGSCHSIPGVRGARGRVAPPLNFFAERTYIAGQVPNTPENLIQWILEPHSIEPGTAMPDVGLTEEAARDAAAYLYTLR